MIAVEVEAAQGDQAILWAHENRLFPDGDRPLPGDFWVASDGDGKCFFICPESELSWISFELKIAGENPDNETDRRNALYRLFMKLNLEVKRDGTH